MKGHKGPIEPPVRMPLPPMNMGAGMSTEKKLNGGRAFVTVLIALAVIVGALSLMIRPLTVAVGDRIDVGTGIKQERWTLGRIAFLAEQQEREQNKTAVYEALGWTGQIAVAALCALIGLFVLAFVVRALSLAGQTKAIQPIPDQVTLVGGRWIVDGRADYRQLDAPREIRKRQSALTQAELIPRERGRR